MILYPSLGHKLLSRPIVLSAANAVLQKSFPYNKSPGRGKKQYGFTSFHTSNVPKQRTPLQEYDYLVSINRLRNDEYQREIISSLESLYDKIAKYKPPSTPIPDVKDLKPKKGLSALMSRFTSKKNNKSELSDDPNAPNNSTPMGIYLYGDVGCGKTMLMDLFYSVIPTHLTKKRIHFHQFMQNIHKMNHQYHLKYGGDFDAIPIISAAISNESNVLCFDEFQVVDVADAMILKRIIDYLLSPAYGTTIFLTSNREPDALYVNGIQRESFIPCIELLKKRNKVIFLDSGTDYRKVEKPISHVYLSPPPGTNLDDPNFQQLAKKHTEDWFDYFRQKHTAEYNIELTVWGRPLIVPKSAGCIVAQYTFQELCGQPLSPGDYLELTRNFTSFIVTDIPFLTINQRDLIRRFINFIDAVYDSHGKMIVTSAAPFKDLFIEDKSGDPDISSKETEDLVKKHGFDEDMAKKAKMFAGDEEKFAFARALSRLHQMSTIDWIEFKH